MRDKHYQNNFPICQTLKYILQFDKIKIQSHENVASCHEHFNCYNVPHFYGYPSTPTIPKSSETLVTRNGQLMGFDTDIIGLLGMGQ